MRSALPRALFGLFEALNPAPQVRLTSEIRQRLVADPITVVDVGAVFGPDKRWQQLGARTCRFITFEADERSQDDVDQGAPFAMRSLPTAISAEPGERIFYLTEGEFASSLYPPNEVVLGAFAVWPWHRLAGTTRVTVDTLDNALADCPDWTPDFIKTDIEGADLDALLGGEAALGGAMGVQVEAAFIERNVGTPLFAEIDQHLRARDFMLFQLLREHWLRSNVLFGAASRPQLIWADVIYFRDAPSFAERLAAAPTNAREVMLTKFVAMLLVHGHFDYAADIVLAARQDGHCSDSLAHELSSSIFVSLRSGRWFTARAAVAVVLAGLIRLAALPFGGAARRLARTLYARHAAPLWNHLYRNAARTGIDNSCIADLP